MMCPGGVVVRALDWRLSGSLTVRSAVLYSRGARRPFVELVEAKFGGGHDPLALPLKSAFDAVATTSTSVVV